MEMREATPQERKMFYTEEWNKRDIPDFLLHSLSLREFGFDLDGTGPSHRYKKFTTSENLADFLRNQAPYSAYASVALYERPSAREGWLKSELVFDIDAKDLPFRACGCQPGKVCERCLNEAREISIQLAETLKGDLGLRNIFFVYSGRGFHLRTNDEAVMGLEQTERGQVVEYVTGATIPTDFTMALGFSKVFRERAARTIKLLEKEQLLSGALKGSVVQRLITEKDKVVEAMRKGELEKISGLEGVGSKSFQRLIELIRRANSQYTDGKVTIDTKRILRLPSSLHSGVGMKCMVVKNIEKFRIEDAIPKFRLGGRSN